MWATKLLSLKSITTVKIYTDVLQGENLKWLQKLNECLHILSIDFYIPFRLLLTQRHQCKQQLGTLWRLCHIQLTLRTEVNSMRLLLCTRQERFNPKFPISLANCHCKMYCWFCKHLSTAFNWAVYINKNMYSLKCWPDQILCHSWNFHMKSCFKEVRHPLLKVVFHCSSSNGVGEGYTPRGFKPVFPYSAFLLPCCEFDG